MYLGVYNKISALKFLEKDIIVSPFSIHPSYTGENHLDEVIVDFFWNFVVFLIVLSKERK